ncbi:MAG: helix-turn-helix domain-containing protein [Oscillospiraceae bacterium]|nr:helix-turn-helix domain-containing protein [Oscillospiraceae bacterium]
MLPTNTRIKKLRKALDLTQQEFADRLGIKRGTAATFERGRSDPSDAAVVLICKTFNVNETWLRTGEGEPFNAPPDSLADKLAQEYGLDDVGRQIMAAYLKLDERDRLAVGQLIQNLVDERAAAELDAHALYEAEARAKAEEYYRELMQEREQTDEPSASPTIAAELNGDLLA